MTPPTLAVELWDGVAWVDIGDRWIHGSLLRDGLRPELGEVRPARATLRLLDADGGLDPDSGSVIDAAWDVGALIRVVATHATVDHTLFTGRIDQLEHSFDGPELVECTVSCTGLEAELGAVRFDGPYRRLAEELGAVGFWDITGQRIEGNALDPSNPDGRLGWMGSEATPSRPSLPGATRAAVRGGTSSAIFLPPTATDTGGDWSLSFVCSHSGVDVNLEGPGQLTTVSILSSASSPDDDSSGALNLSGGWRIPDTSNYGANEWLYTVAQNGAGGLTTLLHASNRIATGPGRGLLDGAPHLVTITCDVGTQTLMHVDGEPWPSTSTNNQSASKPLEWGLLWWHQLASQPDMQVQIEGVALWDRVLTATEVADLHRASLGSHQPFSAGPDTVDSRVDWLLDAAGWDTGRDLAGGRRVLPVKSGRMSEELRPTGATGTTRIWVRPDGEFVLSEELAGTPALTLTEDDIEDWATARDRSRAWDRVEITPRDGAVVAAGSGNRSLSRPTLHADGIQASSDASALLNAGSGQTTQARVLRFRPERLDNWSQTLDLDLFDILSVTFRGSQRRLLVETITHDIGTHGSDWTVSLQTGPLMPDPIILDTSLLDSDDTLEHF